jgi:hypothetical protein
MQAGCCVEMVRLLPARSHRNARLKRQRAAEFPQDNQKV